MVPCQAWLGWRMAVGGAVKARPSAVRGADQILVGAVAPAMFWSDFHSSQLVPSLSVNTRGSMDPPWLTWQMNRLAGGGSGPWGDDPEAEPMHSLAGEVDFTRSVKYSTNVDPKWWRSGAQVKPGADQAGSDGMASKTGPHPPTAVPDSIGTFMIVPGPPSLAIK